MSADRLGSTLLACVATAGLLFYVIAGGKDEGATISLEVPSASPTPSAISGTVTEGTDDPLSQPETAPSPVPLIYTVQPGDTLNEVAAWFALQGYSELWAANLVVIGANPDLIHPGQQIVVPGAYR